MSLLVGNLFQDRHAENALIAASKTEDKEFSTKRKAAVGAEAITQQKIVDSISKKESRYYRKLKMIADAVVAMPPLPETTAAPPLGAEGPTAQADMTVNLEEGNKETLPAADAAEEVKSLMSDQPPKLAANAAEEVKSLTSEPPPKADDMSMDLEEGDEEMLLAAASEDKKFPMDEQPPEAKKPPSEKEGAAEEGEESVAKEKTPPSEPEKDTASGKLQMEREVSAPEEETPPAKPKKGTATGKKKMEEEESATEEETPPAKPKKSTASRKKRTAPSRLSAELHPGKAPSSSAMKQTPAKKSRKKK
jgi:hypothetical protein